MDKKICSVCKQELSLDKFSRNKNGKLGLDDRCRECRKVDSKKYYEKNIEKIRDRDRKYYEKNGDKIKKRKKKYYENNKEDVKRKRRKYCKDNEKAVKDAKKKDYENNREERIKERREYVKLNLEKVKETNRRSIKTPLGKARRARAQNKRRSSNKKLRNDLTLKQWEEIIKLQNNRCDECGKLFTESNPPTRDHIIPVTNPMCTGLTKGNVKALHRACNSSKGNRFMLGNAIDNIIL